MTSDDLTSDRFGLSYIYFRNMKGNTAHIWKMSILILYLNTL